MKEARHRNGTVPKTVLGYQLAVPVKINVLSVRIKLHGCTLQVMK
jgi:hypothetical protein